MRKAFDANVPKLKPRLRPAMAVVPKPSIGNQDESTNISTEPPISEIVTVAPLEISDTELTDTSVPFSAANDFSTPETDGNIQPYVNHQIHSEDHTSLHKRHEMIIQNNVQEDTVGKNEEYHDTRSQQTQNTTLENDSTDTEIHETINIDTTNEQVQPTGSIDDLIIGTQQGLHDVVSRQYTTISPATPAHSIDDSDTRRKRLYTVKRKVADAVRPEVTIEPVPEDPAMAVESVLGLVSDLEAQLSRSRELEKTLRTELAEVKEELTRTVNDGRTASGRLIQAETQLAEKRKILEEMLSEMTALEEERDQAVRMVQILTVKDKERQKEFNDLGNRYTEMQRCLDESKLEEERLNDELDESIAENTRLHTLLAEITRERDVLARNAAQLTKERDELTEAKKALEKVHQALSQARARLRE